MLKKESPAQGRAGSSNYNSKHNTDTASGYTVSPLDPAGHTCHKGHRPCATCLGWHWALHHVEQVAWRLRGVGP
jgi:hypothetical protein